MSRIKQWVQAMMRHKEAWAVIGILIVLIFNLFFSPKFFRISFNEGHLYGSMVDILNRGSSLVIVSLGMCLVIATRGVDISVGSVSAVGAMVAVFLLKSAGIPAVPAILCGLLAGLACGIWNGFLVAKLKIQPMIATLILMTVGRGIAQIISGGQILTINSKAYAFLGRGYVFGIPFPTIIMVIVTLAVWLLTRKTSLGTSIESVGINETSARYAGISTTQILWIVYIVCGLLAALSGMIESANVSSADGNNNGLLLELDAILAVVLGGTSMDGGKFYLAGTVIGALFIQTLTTTIYTFGVPAETIMVVKALVVIFVVLLSTDRVKNAFAKLTQKKKVGVENAG
ncbi:ABC transporter permease [Schleiferilactobacillus harbinensis]|uniref:ABC transporter permease n=1 Tax=Schleiferilactobacillus harbinensis TaxID=304207 RepID=UPI00117209C7|nr:ABC transporter permease [Schleiferilactobacillus harbinensis]GEK07404.1 sugar ABC transporter permease [Schleiferilactobacillus harbinensis]